MLRAVSLPVATLLAVLGIACGGGAGSDGDADPAAAIPADAPFYVEIVARPQGALRDDALAATGKVVGTSDPSGWLREQVEQFFAGSGTKVDYERDVEPWLGERIGFWAEPRDDAAALVLAVTDSDAAMEAIERTRRADGGKLTERTYRDATYFTNDVGTAGGVAGDFAVFGQEAQVKRTIDAIGGDSLADAERYREAVEGLADDRLAGLYVDLESVVELAGRADQSTADALEQLQSIVPLDQLPPLTGALVADDERVALDLELKANGSDALRKLGAVTGAASTPLLRELPADAWAAYGIGDFGDSWRTALDGVGGAMVRPQLEQLGLDVDRDILDWIGDVAFFVRGTTPASLEGGAVIGVTDQERAATAFGKLASVLRTRGGVAARPVRIAGAETAFAVSPRSQPKPIVLARSADRVVVTYGEEAAAAALDPGDELGDSELFAQSTDALGEGLEPSLLVSIPALLAPLDASGGDLGQMRPYLEALSVVSLGASVDEDSARARLAAGLK